MALAAEIIERIKKIAPAASEEDVAAAAQDIIEMVEEYVIEHAADYYLYSIDDPPERDEC